MSVLADVVGHVHDETSFFPTVFRSSKSTSDHLLAEYRADDEDYAEFARLGHLTKARMSQLMNLLCLAPDIQESILFLPQVTKGKDSITERHLRSIAAILDWRRQSVMWQGLLIAEAQLLFRLQFQIKVGTLTHS